MPNPPANFFYSQKLACQGAALLEHTNTCRQRAAHLHNAFNKLAGFFEYSQNEDINFFIVEANLRNAVSLLRGVFEPITDNSSAKILQLIYAKRAYQALLYVEHRLQTLTHVHHVCFEFPVPPISIEEMDLNDAEEDQLHLEEMITHYQDQGYDQVDTLLLMIKDKSDMDLADIVEGKAGTETEQQALQEFTSMLQGTHESEIATLEQGTVSIESPDPTRDNGSFGTVLFGILRDDDGVSIPIATKKYRKVTASSEFAERKALINEAECCRGLFHNNIICLLGTCIIQNQFHLVMDQCDLSLAHVLSQMKQSDTHTTLSLDDKERILCSITKGLCYLHDQNVVHSNLQPANVMLRHDLGLAKLANFGLAARTRPNTSQTYTIALPHSSRYMAPEVLQAPVQWTTKADIYSLGMMSWEIYHEKVPYDLSLLPGEIESMVLAGMRPAIYEEASAKSWVTRVIELCWSQNPGERPSAEEALKKFEARGVKRRSSRLIRGIAGTFSKLDRRRSTKATIEIERVQGFVRDLVNPNERANLLNTLGALRNILEGEFKNGEGQDQLRSEVRTRGILVHLQRILGEQKDDPKLISEALWTLHFALSGETAYEYIEAAMTNFSWGSDLICILQEQASNAEVQLSVFASLRSLVTVHEGNRIALVQDLNLGSEIVAVMRAFPSNAQVQEQSCILLCSLASNNSNRDILIQDSNAGAEIMTAMGTHQTNAKVQEEACRALYNLVSGNDRNCEILVEEMSVGAEIAAAMSAHQSDANVQLWACKALQNLSNNFYNSEILLKDVDSGSIIQEAIRAHRIVAEVQEQAFRALYILAQLSNDNREVLEQTLNVHVDILTAMRDHRSNANVQTEACRVFHNLALSSRNRETLREDLSVAGAEILAAMREHRSQADVQESAVGALCVLGYNDDTNCKILVQDLNVGAEIMAAMRAHRENVNVQTEACRTLWTLGTMNTRNADILLQNQNAGREIMIAMRTFRMNEELQELACGALRSLSLSDRNKELLGQDLNLLAEIVATMREHDLNLDIQCNACGALRALASGDRNKHVLGQDLNLCLAIINTMRIHRTDEDTQEEICAILQYLTESDRNKVILGQTLNLGAEITATMSEHPANAYLQENACKALSNLATNERNSVILGQNSDVGLQVVAAMQEHEMDDNVQRNACEALLNLSASQVNSAILGRDINAGGYIVVAMHTHRMNVAVQLHACGALRNLAENENNNINLALVLNAGAEIVVSMQAHRMNGNVQKQACEAIYVMACNREVVSQLIRVGACEAVQAAHRRFPFLGICERAYAKLK